MKVYGVFSLDTEDYKRTLEKLFLNKKDAERYAKEYEQHIIACRLNGSYVWGDETRIEELEIE